MKSDYRKVGDFIRQAKIRNDNVKITRLLGVNLDKKLMPSVANLNGVDLSKYKIIKKGQFGCKLMSVGRDKKVPIARLMDYKEAIISTAYFVFEVTDENLLSPEYLMMWFSRSESDRFQWFQSGGDVRGRITWDDFCNLPIKVPSIEKQREIVKEYNTVVNRIKLNEELNQKLEETAQALYKHWFVDFDFPNEEGKPYKSSGGKMEYNEELDKEIPAGWECKQLDEIAEVVDSLHKTPVYSLEGYPMVRVTDINAGFLNLSKTMRVNETIFNDFSRNHNSSKGDIIVSRVGASYGEFSYAHTNEKFCLGQNTAVIIPNRIDSKLIYTSLISSQLREQIEKLVSGSAYSTFSLKDIKQLKICLPSEKLKPLLSQTSVILDGIFSKRSFHCSENLILEKLYMTLLSKMSKVEIKK